MKKKHQPRFKNRAAAIEAIMKVREVVPTHLGKTEAPKLEDWHCRLDAAVNFLERLILPPEVACAKSLKLRLKTELENRRKADSGLFIAAE